MPAKQRFADAPYKQQLIDALFSCNLVHTDESRISVGDTVFYPSDFLPSHQNHLARKCLLSLSQLGVLPRISTMISKNILINAAENVRIPEDFTQDLAEIVKEYKSSLRSDDDLVYINNLHSLTFDALIARTTNVQKKLTDLIRPLFGEQAIATEQHMQGTDKIYIEKFLKKMDIPLLEIILSTQCGIYFVSGFSDDLGLVTDETADRLRTWGHTDVNKKTQQAHITIGNFPDEESEQTFRHETAHVLDFFLDNEIKNKLGSMIETTSHILGKHPDLPDVKWARDKGLLNSFSMEAYKSYDDEEKALELFCDFLAFSYGPLSDESHIKQIYGKWPDVVDALRNASNTVKGIVDDFNRSRTLDLESLLKKANTQQRLIP